MEIKSSVEAVPRQMYLYVIPVRRRKWEIKKTEIFILYDAVKFRHSQSYGCVSQKDIGWKGQVFITVFYF